jgi:hypothetical protein
MPDLDDFEIDGRSPEDDASAERALETNPSLERTEPGIPKTLIVGATVVLLAAVFGVFLLLRRPAAPAAAVLPAPLASATPSSPTEPGAPLPTLAESDHFVRDLARGLSAHPQLGAWLAVEDLVRTLTVTVQNVAEGRSPARFLPFLTPAVRFAAVEKNGRLLADPKSHAAYDDFADAVASIDAAECTRVYGVLAPLFGSAYAELGYPAGDFGKAVARALSVIRDTPRPASEIELVQGKIFLEFKDPKLETLSLARKQLLRMGPRNAGLVQAKASELLKALVIEPPT